MDMETKTITHRFFDGLNQQVLGAIDQGFQQLHTISNATLRAELQNSLDTITADIQSKIKTELKNALMSSQGEFVQTMHCSLSQDDINSVVDQVVNPYSGDHQGLIHALNGTAIQDAIVSEVQMLVRDKISVAYGEVENLTSAAMETVRSMVMDAYDKAVSTVLSKAQATLKDEYNRLSGRLEGVVEKKVASLVGSLVPCGLPILPPFGWWCTLNVWYIEVAGEMPEFKVVDVHDETLVNPLFGHDAQEYKRIFRYVRIDTNGDDIEDKLVGVNLPLSFGYNTGTFIIVPPMKTGVGDRSGGWDELSQFGNWSLP